MSVVKPKPKQLRQPIKFLQEPMRTLRKNKLPETREKRDQVAVGFSFESDWIRKWREFSGPITQRSEAKTMQSRIPSTPS